MFLDNESSSEVFQTLLAVPHFIKLHGKARSSRPEMFCKKSAFENFANQRCFPVNFAKFSRTHFFNRTLPVAASEKLKAEAIVSRCSLKKVFLEILLNSQENTCVKALGMQLY